jgi:hypothetical protein
VIGSRLFSALSERISSLARVGDGSQSHRFVCDGSPLITPSREKTGHERTCPFLSAPWCRRWGGRNKGGVVSGVFNLESSGVSASDWRPRHDKHYHEA